MNNEQWVCIIDNEIYKIRTENRDIDEFIKNYFKNDINPVLKLIKKNKNQNQQQNENQHFYNLLQNVNPMNYPRIIYKNYKNDASKSILYLLLCSDVFISNFLDKVLVKDQLKDIEKYLYFYEALTNNLSYDDNKIISITNESNIKRDDLLKEFRTKKNIDGLNQCCYFKMIKKEKDYKKYEKKLILEINQQKDIDEKKDCIFPKNQYLLIKCDNSALNDIKIDNKKYKIKLDCKIDNNLRFILYEKYSPQSAGFINKSKFSCLPNKKSRLNYTNSYENNSLNINNNNLNFRENLIIAGGGSSQSSLGASSAALQQQRQYIYGLFHDLENQIIGDERSEEYNSDFLEKCKDDTIEYYEDNFDEDMKKKIKKDSTIFDKGKINKDWRIFEKLTKAKDGFKSFLKYLSSSFTIDAKKASKKLDKLQKEEEKKKIWSEICKKYELKKDNKTSQNPRFKKALEEFFKKAQDLMNNNQNHNIDKINRKFKKIINQQIRNLKLITRKEFLIKEKGINKKNNQEKATLITNKLSKLELLQKFTKDLYNQFNELYKKGDESKEIDKFKLYIFNKSTKKYYFNSYLFNLIINGRLHREFNQERIKDEFRQTIFSGNKLINSQLENYTNIELNKKLPLFFEKLDDICKSNEIDFHIEISRIEEKIYIVIFEDLCSILSSYEKFYQIIMPKN